MTKIVYAPFPYLDKDNSKNRPLLVLAENENLKYPTVIVAYITTQKNEQPLETDFILDQTNKFFKETGLQKDSVIRLHKLGCIQKSSIKWEIGTLPSSATLEIKSKLKKLFNL